MKIVLADGGLSDVLAAFKNVRPPRNPVQARQASPGGGPPYPEEQPGAENVGHDSQVAEHLPPNKPPQSPNPQDPPAKEAPTGGIDPRRFYIGVPVDSLGLLGIGGDMSFVDRPLV